MSEAEVWIHEKMGLANKFTIDDKQRETLAKLNDNNNLLAKSVSEFVSAEIEGNHEKALAGHREVITAGYYFRTAELVKSLVDRERELVKEGKLQSNLAQENIVRALGAGTLLMIVVAFTLGLWIVRGTNRAISEATNTISTSAKEIAATVTQQERAAVSQASMVNETTVTVDELNVSSKQTSEQAAAVVDIARKTSSLTDEGSTVVSQAMEGVSGLRGKIGVVEDQILQLGEHTSQIGNITNLLRDLATQTNMLALNAAVEAARAGEHGKGFAVVASEVRRLADLSKKSAEEATVIISDIQKATNSTIMVTEESTKTVEEVAKISHKVGHLFEALSGEANRVFENAQQVVLNSKQQFTAMNQIGEAMKTINASVKETAAGVTQTKIGVQNLEEAAQALQTIV
jgi:methyl-accepting chemotaxis protein